MARVTHVKKAQQRYAMVPVLVDGVPQEVAVKNRDGSPKTTKHGRPITRALTVADRNQPLPPEVCDYCREPIAVGTPYMWIEPRTGGFSTRKVRHSNHPAWHVWEYSNSLSARLSQIEHDAMQQVDSVESEEDVTAILSEAAEAIREVAEEKRESASNIEEGFGHSTYQSDELNEQADSLDSWADKVESADVPDLPGEVQDEDEDGTPLEANGDTVMKDCDECNGTGQVTPDDPTDEQMDEWRQAVEEALSILSEQPV